MEASAIDNQDAGGGSVPVQPHHPDGSFSFPKRSFGQKKSVLRSFQPGWFVQWPFLHYDEALDVAYCHTCLLCYKQKRLKAANADPAFVSHKLP